MFKKTINSYFIKLLAVSCWILLSQVSQSQTSLTIEECYRLAIKNYPLVKQVSLIEKSKQYSIENANKGYLPQVSINGQGTYQSDVTSFSIPGVTTTSLSKDQYRLYGEISQTVTDGGIIKQQKELVKATAETEQQKIEVELYKLKDRINQLFFGILLIDTQIEQTELLKKDIQAGIDKNKRNYSQWYCFKK